MLHPPDTATLRRVLFFALLAFCIMFVGVGVVNAMEALLQGVVPPAAGARQLSAGTCQDSSARTFTVSTFTELKNAIACANENTNDMHRIFVNQDVQATGIWASDSALVVEDNAKLEITGIKAGSNVTAIRGQGQSGGYRFFYVKAGADVTLSNLDLRDGYASVSLAV